MKALIVLFMAGLLQAQPTVAPGHNPADDDNFKIRENVRVVMVPVTAMDRTGAIVTGLTPTDFRLTDNGKPQKITQDLTTHLLSIVVVIQANAQVEKFLPRIQKIAADLQAQVIGDAGEAAIIQFDHHITTLTDFTSDPDKITMALKKLKAGSGSARLNDATIEAVNMLRKRPVSRRKVVLLMAESQDQGTEIHVREVLTATNFADVVVYSIDISHLTEGFTGPAPAPQVDTRPPGAVHLTMGQVMTPTLQSQSALGNWMPLFKGVSRSTRRRGVPNPTDGHANYSGGRQYAFASHTTLDRAISDLGEELHSQYLLTYSPNNQDEIGFHNVVVEVLEPGLKIRAREGYYLAGMPQ